MSKNSNKKVLVVATSRKTRGGITSVISAYESSSMWNEFNCRWIETHVDRCAVCKFIYFLKGLLTYIFVINSYDIIHIHTSEPPSAIRKCAFMAIAKLARKKTIVHFHSFSPDTTIKGKYSKLYKYLFSKADKVIALSKMWKDYINDTFNLGDKVQVIYNPCTAQVSEKEYPKLKQILYAGTLNKRKGYSDLIKAFARIADKYPEWKIVFAGNGEMEEATALVKDLGVDKQVEFLGWVSGEGKNKAFKESSVFCLPSHAEGFPMAVLDAWAYSLPVITTPVGGIPEFAIDGVNVLLFTPGDIVALSEKMEQIINDIKLRGKLIAQSSSLAKDLFSIEAVTREMIKVYDNIN